MRKIILLIGLVLLLVVGCSGSLAGDTVAIIPSKVFEGDAKKLEYHMDMITGCVKVKYKGDKQSLGISYEIWEKGELKESHNTTSTIIRNGFEGEVSISLKDITSDDSEKSRPMQIKTIINDENGHIGSAKIIEGFNQSYSYGAREISEKLITSDDEETIIWGFTAYEGALTIGPVDIREQAEQADWGLVVKINFK